jgi:uncharacterized protein (TIGR00251 family)
MPSAPSPLPAWARLTSDAQHLALALYVQPNARRSEIAGRHGAALKVRVAAPAIDDRANQALLELLHETLGVPKAALRIVRGRTARQKTVTVAAGAGELMRRIREMDLADQ